MSHQQQQQQRSSLRATTTKDKDTGAETLEDAADEDVDRMFYGEGGDADASALLFFGGDAAPAAPASGPGQRRDKRGFPGSEAQAEWEGRIASRGGGSGGNAGLLLRDVAAARDARAHVVVRVNKPAFLGDKVWTTTTRARSVDVVRDRASDIARAAERGSIAVRTWREKNSKTAMRHKFWELGGSTMGKAIGDKSKSQFVAREEAASEDTASTSRASEVTSAPTEPSTTPTPRVNQELPISRVLPALLKTIRENQVVIVVGETGSGKTTRLPIAIWREGGGIARNGIVACTQPRRVAAMSVAVRVAQEYGTPVGEEVGYSIRFEDKTSRKTKVKYMTDGVLLRESLNDAELDKYACVVMDEAHERSLNTDVLFGVLKNVVRARLDFRLVVTSATLDADRFAAYFGGAPVFTIPGRTFHVEKYFAKTPVADYVEAAVKQVLQIHLTLPPGDILVFMTGQEDITATCELVAERLGKMLMAAAAAAAPPPTAAATAAAAAVDAAAPPPSSSESEDAMRARLVNESLLLLPMYSTLSAELQARIFEPAGPGQRKCVVSTNVAETSLTVDGIRYVVDCGFAKTNVFNPRVGMDALRLVPISQAAADQRAGRAGRTAAGFCYRLFTDVQFKEEMLTMTVPEIQRTNLAAVVLLLKSLGVDNPLSFDFMDPPPVDILTEAMHQLWVLGALADDGSLTPVGRRMVEFPLDPALAKMLLHAEKAGCASEVATIVAMLSVPDVFFRPPDRAEEADAARERFVVPESDQLTLLNVFTQWKRNQRSAAWCAQHFVHAKAVRRAEEVRVQLSDVMRKERIPETEVGPTGWDVVRKCVCAGYFPNAAHMQGIGSYVHMLNGLPVFLHPSSSLFGGGQAPDYVVYHELVLTTKEYMRAVTAVEGEWLAELGGVFFSLRGQASQHVAQQQQQVSQQQQAQKNKVLVPSGAAPPSKSPAPKAAKKRGDDSDSDGGVGKGNAKGGDDDDDDDSEDEDAAHSLSLINK